MLAIYLIFILFDSIVRELLPSICSLMCLLDSLPSDISKCPSGKKFMSIIDFQAANGIRHLLPV